MLFDVKKLDAAADSFSEIAFRADGWSTALDALGAAVGATGTIVFAVTQAQGGSYPISPSLDSAVTTYIRDGWVERDVRMKGVPILLRRGIVTDFQFQSNSMIARDPYYQEFLRSSGLGWFAGLRLNIGSHGYSASIQRPFGMAPFSDEELAGLLSVGPRISMALSILEQINRARLTGIVEALEAMTTAAFLLDRDGRVIRSNAGAEKVVGRGIDVVDGQLYAAGPDNALLQRSISDVFRAIEVSSPLSGCPIVIRRVSARPLLIRVQRLRTEAALDYFSRAWGIVTVTNLDNHQVATKETLKNAFGLTNTEAKIAELLILHDGDSSAILSAANITYETLRSHLKKLHIKCDTRTVGSLVGLLTRASKV